MTFSTAQAATVSADSLLARGQLSSARVTYHAHCVRATDLLVTPQISTARI